MVELVRSVGLLGLGIFYIVMFVLMYALGDEEEREGCDLTVMYLWVKFIRVQLY